MSFPLNTISIERISEAEFASVKEQWSSLLDRSITNEVFLSWEWMFSWWDAFKDDSKQLLILTGTDKTGKLVGIAPFYIEKKIYFGIECRNVVRFCSSRETAPDHLDILCDKEFGQDFPQAVFTYLQEHYAAWDVISLDGIREDSMIKSYVTGNNESMRYIVDCSVESTCPYLALNQNFKDYLGSFSGKTRSTLLRKRKTLLEKEKCEYGILNADTADLDKYIKELFSLHAERTRRKNVKTAFAGEKTYRFHENLIKYLLKEDKIVIAFLSKEAAFLASYYCVKHNNKYYYYQTGISEQGEQKSAGTVLLSLMVEKAFNEGCREFDFLRGSEKYKYFWTKDARVNYSLFIRKGGLSNRIAHYFFCNLVRPMKKNVKKYLYL